VTVAERDNGGPTAVWLGDETERTSSFGGGKLWIGTHSSDRDILVFDPAESDPNGEVLTLDSLTHHRTRSFPRSTVIERIDPVTDRSAITKARKAYEGRSALRVAHEETLEKEKTARKTRQRESLIAAHQNYLERLGLPYEGVRERGTGGSTRVLKCHACGIALDDFVGAVCVACSGALCTCGGCACGKPAKVR
jgi:hypothetical protein